VHFADPGRAFFEKFKSLPRAIRPDMEKRHVDRFDADLGASFAEPDQLIFVL